jgi:hypothetical protein
MEVQDMTLPNVVCIGAQRTGTTWLYACLSEHPQVFLPDEKDLSYFRGWRGRPSLYETAGLAPFEDLFKAGARFPVRMDISAGLLSGARVPSLMRGALPDCRFIVILREPVARAISHYRFILGRAPVPYTLEQLAANPDLPDPHEILWEGLYARHLKEFFRYYPRERFLILFYEDLFAAPLAFVRRVCTFLGVDSEFTPTRLHEAVNKPYRSRTRLFYFWGETVGSFLLAHRLHRLRRLLKRSPLLAMFRFLNRSAEPAKSPTDTQKSFGAGTLEALTDYYRADTLELQALLGHDLPAWARPSQRAEAALRTEP